MPTNLPAFNVAMEAAAKKVAGDEIKFYQSVCLEVFIRIIMRTPVDTGRARGNWQIEINQMAEGTVEEYSKEDDDLTVILKQDSKLSSIQAFSVVHITNNVEYVYYLEYEKRSSQHPEGMVEVTVAEMKEWALNLSQMQ